MKKYTIRPYQPTDYEAWNSFVKVAKNATFLFHRDFMEYHADRFTDFSLMIFDGNQLISILPANKVDHQVYSHQGLTYGGLVFNEKIKLGEVIHVFKSILEFLKNQNVNKLHLKLIPSIYNTFFSEEIEYALFLINAKLTRRDCLSVLDLTKQFYFSKTRRQSIRKGLENKLVIVEESNFDFFWDSILTPNLQKKHQAKPVHSLDEIKKLQEKFPQNIRHFNVYHENQIVAGTTIFESDLVAHPQYISGNEHNNKLGSLDFLYNHLILEVFKNKKYFDFGPSHEENGKKINQGILFWKESYDTKTIVQDFYEINTSQFTILEHILL